MKRWEAVFTDEDRALVGKTGFGKRQEFGKRPALIIIDVNRAFTGSQPRRILESVEEYHTSCGEAGWAALEHIRKLLMACRDQGLPVIYTTNDAVTRQHCRGPTKISNPSGKIDLEGQDIAEAIKPLPSELVIKKCKASAFFGTPLLAALHYLKVDSLLITGTTTSGCVRASVVDAISYDFPCFVVEECVFDRFQLSHLVNLWDMNAKYADVITLEEALAHVEGLS